eukprot:COSAG01_NODE_1776_length_9261_cov_12.399694_4_plen_183_part_00
MCFTLSSWLRNTAPQPGSTGSGAATAAAGPDALLAPWGGGGCWAVQAGRCCCRALRLRFRRCHSCDGALTHAAAAGLLASTMAPDMPASCRPRLIDSRSPCPVCGAVCSAADSAPERFLPPAIRGAESVFSMVEPRGSPREDIKGPEAPPREWTVLQAARDPGALSTTGVRSGNTQYCGRSS